MSKVINKKLHPYYKTGIYGWFGEEVDDNDYIICPICGEVLGMNYCDYAGEQGYDNKCPKCKQELDYSEIYDFEDTLYFRQLLEIKESRLADLEAKLAGLQQEKIEYTDTINFVETSEPDIVAKELDRLNQKLAESVKECTELFSRNIELETLYSQKTALLNFYKDTDLVKENKELKQQLAEKEFEIKKLNTRILVSQLQAPEEQRLKIIGSSCCQYNPNQDKISFAVEQLEKIDEFTKSGYCFDLFDVRNEIDNQIKAIKGEK